MSAFIDFIHKNEMANAKTEEERLAMHKKQKLREAQEDDDFYDEELPEEPINEAIRVPFKGRRPVPAKKEMVEEPEEQPQRQYCVPKPTQADVAATNADIRQYGVRPVKKVKRELDFDPGFNESTQPRSYNARPVIHENPVLREAYNMMDEMKKKIEDMFYQYGMTGLEKLNESMLDVFEDILNPPVRVQEPRVVERVVEVPAQPKTTIKKKVLKKKPAITPAAVKPTVKSNPEPVETPVQTEKLTPATNIADAKEILKENVATFETINSTADLSALGNCLNEQKIVQQTTESEADQKLKRLNANVERLKKAMDESNKVKATAQIEAAEEEPYEQPEEFDVVDDSDSTDIDLEQIEAETK